MPKLTGKLLSAALPLAALLVLAGSAQAQVTTRAEIPFAFEANGTTFDAGTYHIEPDWSKPLLVIRGTGKQGHALLTLPMENPAGEGQARLVFRRIGGAYYLSEAWMPHGGVGRQIPLSKAVELEGKRRGTGRVEVALTR